MFKTVMRYESMKRHFLLFVRVISTLTALYIVLGEGKKNRSRQKGIFKVTGQKKYHSHERFGPGLC